MALLKNSAALYKGLFFNTSASSNQLVLQCPACFPVYYYRRRNYSPQARAEVSPSTEQGCFLERLRRRQVLSLGAMAACIPLYQANPASLAAEVKKGFQFVSDTKDGYSFLYPFGWQEVVVQGQDKVFKDVIEPLESVSVNMVPTSKQDVRELGSPQEVADALIKRVLAPPSQKIKLVEASEHDVDGKAYYTFEFTAQAPNFTRHALGAIVIANESRGCPEINKNASRHPKNVQCSVPSLLPTLGSARYRARYPPSVPLGTERLTGLENRPVSA